MKTLQDLRHTLDEHAATVPSGDLNTARVAAVRGRARKVRRQRAAGIGVAAVLAVAAATAVPTLTGGSPSPADRTVLGEVAPATFTSLHWTYRYTDSAAEPDARRVTETVESSDLPRLVSWTTASDFQDVTVRIAGETPRYSSRGDFDDFVLLPPSYSGRVSVTGVRPGVGLAVYEVDTDHPPVGVGAGALTFREVAGRALLGATVGGRGQASIEVDVTPGRRMLWLGYVCESLPRGARMNIAFTDEEGAITFGGGCDSVFDPGGNAGTGIPPGRHAGQPSTLRMWVTRGGEPVADGEIPGLRLALGVYTPVGLSERMAGTALPQTIEYDGHVWALRTSSAVAPLGSGTPPKVLVPDDDQYVVVDAVKARGTLRHTLTVDRKPFGGTSMFAGGPGVGTSSGGPTPVPGGTTVSMKFHSDPTRVVAAGIAVYRLVH